MGGYFMSLGPETMFNKRVGPASPAQKPVNNLKYTKPNPIPESILERTLPPQLVDAYMNGSINQQQPSLPQPMQAAGKKVRLPSGEIAMFPPDLPDDQIINDIGQMQQQNQQAQNFQNQHPLAQGLQQLVGPQFGFQPPTQNEFKIPVVPGNTFGMKPETLNNTLGIIQNTQNSNAAERIRQRVQMEQEMEREKDRSQQLKLEQQRMKNQMMMEKMREQREAAKLKAEGEKGSIYNTTDGPIWAGMGPSGPTARAIPVEGRAGATGKFKPLPGGAETAMINGKLTTAYTLYNEETGETKFIELGATPADNVELQLIETVDEAGRPSRRFVRKEEGASYPMPPKPESRAGQLTEYQEWQIQQAKQAKAESTANTRLAAMVEDDPDLGTIDGNRIIPTAKGLPLWQRFYDEALNKGGQTGNFVPSGENTFDWEP